MSKRATRLNGRLLTLIGVLGFCLLAAAPAAAKTKAKEAFVPKQGEERQSLILAPLEKRFVVTPALSLDYLDRLLAIENALIEVDGEGQVPPKSFLQGLAAGGRPLTLVLPLALTDGHRRRLALLKQYDVVFRADAQSLTAEVAAGILALGPRRKVFEITPPDLGKALQDGLARVKQYETRVLVADGQVLGADELKVLVGLSGPKEVVVPIDYPAEAMSKLLAVKNLRLLLRVRGSGPSPELAKTLARYKKAHIGLWTRGLIKREELPSYRMVGNLRLLVMSVENWEVSDTFVALMNSHGEF